MDTDEIECLIRKIIWAIISLIIGVFPIIASILWIHHGFWFWFFIVCGAVITINTVLYYIYASRGL